MKIIKGKRIKPLAILLYGIHGIGKSTFALEAPNPIYVGSEENDELDVHRMPKVQVWDDIINQLKFLMTSEHEYKTLVIDTIDALEQVAQKAILKKAPGKTMATAFEGFGKAYIQMSDMFLDLRDNYIVPLRDKKGMNIIILAHAEKNKHEDPMTGTSYDNYSTTMHKRVKPIFEDWVSAIFFATWELLKTETSSGKERAIGDGTRIIYTEERPSHIAKNRFELPYEIEFIKGETWKEVTSLIKEFYKADIRKELDFESLLNQVDESARAKIELSISRAKDNHDELNRIHTKLEKLVKGN